nr:MAG TPA: hypothetical protein [Caudoviricetes sp.]
MLHLTPFSVRGGGMTAFFLGTILGTILGTTHLDLRQFQERCTSKKLYIT